MKQWQHECLWKQKLTRYFILRVVSHKWLLVCFFHCLSVNVFHKVKAFHNSHFLVAYTVFSLEHILLWVCLISCWVACFNLLLCLIHVVGREFSGQMCITYFLLYAGECNLHWGTHVTEKVTPVTVSQRRWHPCHCVSGRVTPLLLCHRRRHPCLSNSKKPLFFFFSSKFCSLNWQFLVASLFWQWL